MACAMGYLLPPLPGLKYRLVGERQSTNVRSQNPNDRRALLERLCVWSIILGLWLFFFWPMMSGQTVAGYRDSSYLYYPMFHWIDQQMASGNFPLWMPFDESGFPLLADGTSCMLYPGKLIFSFRFLSFPSRYGIYLAMHVLLAAVGTYWMARFLGALRLGSCLAAISYAFGGSLLFQVCNVIYLVSGAWLPIALTCVWRMLATHRGGIGWAIGAGAACSMMILGGDPQMVYHVGLIAAATILVSLCRHWWRELSACDSREASLNPWRQLGRLLVMVAVTSGLSAAQLIPTMQWAAHSNRADADYPLNIYDVQVGDLASLTSARNTPPISDIYQFSLEPWSVLELVWSNVFGKDAPVNTRWTAAFPGAERVWMPSIYFGVIPFLLAISGMRLWRRAGNTPEVENNIAASGSHVWLTWISLWFLMASFGWYGPVWFWNEVSGDAPENLHRGAGGIYWLMVTVLPKYFLFRYPAKLFVIAALGMCVLAGIQLQSKSTALPRGHWWWALFAFSCIGLLAMVFPTTTTALAGCQSTGLFGPFQVDLCRQTILLALAKTAVIGLIIAFLLRSKPKRIFFPFALLVLTVIDLGVSNPWMLHPVASETLTSPTRISQQIADARSATGMAQLEMLTIDRRDQTCDSSPDWFTTSSADRIAQVVKWRRESLFPKTHLELEGIQVMGSFCSIMPAAYESSETTAVADGWIATSANSTMLRWSSDPQPMAWFDDAQSSDPMPVVQWVDNRMVISVAAAENVKENRTLHVRVLPMPGWQARFIDTSGGSLPLPIVSSGQMQLSIEASADAGRIELSYQPWTFSIGVMVSAISLILCLVFVGWSAVGWRERIRTAR